jgi:BNR repeat-like domain
MKKAALVMLAAGLFFISSEARAQWTSAERITWTGGESYSPVAAVDSLNHLHVFWYDYTPGNAEIYYKRSEYGGNSWTSARRLTWNSGNSSSPAVAVDSLDHLHVVWFDQTPGNAEIYYKRSADGGNSWTAGRRLTWNSGYSQYPAIAIDASDHIHVVWQDTIPGSYEIYYKRSEDGGDSWTAPSRITWTLWGSEYPRVAVDSSGHLHVAWVDETPLNFEVFYKRSEDGGDNWTAGQRLTWTSGSSYNPAIVFGSSGSPHMFWDDNTSGLYEIYTKKSEDGGDSWLAAQRLTWTEGSSSSPAIGVDSLGQLHLVWEDFTPGHAEIFYKESTDGGDSWSAGQRLTWNWGHSSSPSLAVDSLDRLHVFWNDETPGNREIYYIRKN